MAKASPGNRALLADAGGLALLLVAWRFPVPAVPYLWSAPTTLLSVIAVLLGFWLGWRHALGVTLAYVLAVILGVPHLLWEGTTGNEGVFFEGRMNGYALGLTAAALAAAWIAPNGQAHAGRLLLATLAAHVVYLACGAAWLTRFVPPHEAVAVGIVSYLAPALAKSVLAFAIIYLSKRFIK